MAKKYKLKALLSDVTVEINGNLEISGKAVSKIVMREPSINDIKLVGHIEDQIENNATLIGNLTGYTPDEILSLPVHIFQVLVEGLETFQYTQETTS